MELKFFQTEFSEAFAWKVLNVRVLTIKKEKERREDKALVISCCFLAVFNSCTTKSPLNVVCQNANTQK
jgi:phosphatidylserine decarboxylase